MRRTPRGTKRASLLSTSFLKLTPFHPAAEGAPLPEGPQLPQNSWEGESAKDCSSDFQPIYWHVCLGAVATSRGNDT